MPRDGSGIYALPQIDFVPGSIISSAKVNSDLDDLAADLNVARPIVAGGTGATTAAAARTALGSGTVGDAVFLTTTKPAAQAAIGVREVLTAARTYFVRTDGSDSNTGLVNSAGGAFLTIQKAINVILGAIDLAGFDVTVSVAAGTYTGTIAMSSPQIGAGNIILAGDVTTPSNVLLSVAGQIITVTGFGAKLKAQGFKFASSSGFGAVSADAGGFITLSGKCEFGTCAGYHLAATAGGIIFNVGAEEVISGGAPGHYFMSGGGYIQTLFSSWTLSGTPAFATAFVVAQSTGVILAAANTTTGSATGSRYSAITNAVINASGGGASYFPGGSAGSTATGGQYV